MMTLAYLLAVAVITVALVTGHVVFWRWYYHRPRTPDERHYVTTADGWTIAIARIRPRASGPATGEPVVCFPGLACNGRLFDFDDQHSLAQHLAGLGFDVWMIDPRGMGESERPGFFGRGWKFGFGAYAQLDAPAALRRVLEVTGRQRVLWVGHSMGGLVGCHLAFQPLGDHIAGIVTLGSPADFSFHREGLGRFHALVLDRFLRGWPVVRLGRLTTAIAPLAGWWRGWPETMFTHARNTHARSLRHFLVEVVEDVPRQLLDEFADQVLRGTGFDGRPVHLTYEALRRARLPVMALAGDIDRIAPPRSVHAVLTQLTCEDATQCLVGSIDTVQFGHLDLLVGEGAPREIYPRVADWLLARRSICSMLSDEAPAAFAAASAASQPG